MTLPPLPYNKYNILREHHEAVMAAQPVPQSASPGTAVAQHTAVQDAGRYHKALTNSFAQRDNTALSKQNANQLTEETNRDLESLFKQGSRVLSQQGSQPFFSEGSAQVVVVPCETQGTPETPCISQGGLAGALPHAPHPPRRERKKPRSRARKNFTLRMSDDMRIKLEAKASSVESYPSTHVLELIAADLCLPIDDYRVTRNRGLKKSFADLRVAFDDCGVNLNQMAKATNSGKACPLTREEIGDALNKFNKGCATLESLRPS